MVKLQDRPASTVEREHDETAAEFQRILAIIEEERRATDSGEAASFTNAEMEQFRVDAQELLDRRGQLSDELAAAQTREAAGQDTEDPLDFKTDVGPEFEKRVDSRRRRERMAKIVREHAAGQPAIRGEVSPTPVPAPRGERDLVPPIPQQVRSDTAGLDRPAAIRRLKGLLRQLVGQQGRLKGDDPHTQTQAGELESEAQGLRDRIRAVEPAPEQREATPPAPSPFGAVTRSQGAEAAKRTTRKGEVTFGTPRQPASKRDKLRRGLNRNKSK